MIFVPFKKLYFETVLSAEEFEEKFKELVEYSKSKNFFTSRTDDILIRGVIRGNSFSIRKKFFDLPIKVRGIIKEENNSIIEVNIKYDTFSLVMRLVFIVCAFFLPFPLLIPIIFLVINYLFMIIPLQFYIWWVEDVFEKEFK